MIPVHIRIKEGAQLPEYQSEGAAGADLCAFVEEPIIVKPGAWALVPTGVFISMPAGYEAQIRPRSGLALRHGITLLNTPGTIDSDYRGEIQVILANLGTGDFAIENGMRIAQIIFNRVLRAHFIEKVELDLTQRNDGGFGHTGL